MNVSINITAAQIAVICIRQKVEELKEERLTSNIPEIVKQLMFDLQDTADEIQKAITEAERPAAYHKAF